MQAILAGTPDHDAFTLSNIATPSWLGYRDGKDVRNGKPKLLKLLLAKATGRAGGGTALPKGAVLFFDDQRSNIESCKTKGYPRAIYVPDGFARGAIGDVKKQQVRTHRTRRASQTPSAAAPTMR